MIKNAKRKKKKCLPSCIHKFVQVQYYHDFSPKMFFFWCCSWYTKFSSVATISILDNILKHYFTVKYEIKWSALVNPIYKFIYCLICCTNEAS